MKNIVFSFLFLLLPVSSLADPITANALFKEPDSSMLRMSPNGEYVSRYFRGEKDKFFELISLDKNKVVSSIPIGIDNELDYYNWLNSDYIMLNVEGKYDEVSVLVHLNNNKIILNEVEASGYLVHSFPERDNQVLFAKNKEGNSGFYELFIIDIMALAQNDFSNAILIEPGRGDVRFFSYDPLSKNIITRQIDYDEETLEIGYMPVDGGKWRRVLFYEFDDDEESDSDYSIKMVGLIDEETISILTNKDTDKVVLREFDTVKQEQGKIIYQHPQYDLSSANYSELGQLDYVTYYQHGLRKWHYFERDKETMAKRFSNTFVNKEAYLIDHSSDKSKSLLYVNGSNQPGEYFIYEKESDVIKRFSVTYEELQDVKLFPSQLITVKTNDGTNLEAFLTLPTDLDYKTLLVKPHGGPIGIQENDRFNKETQYYVSRGFSILRVNFRGSAGFGKAFQDRGVGEFGKLIEEDISAVVNEVLKKYQFDYMCAVGASYGGYSSAMLAIKHPEKYDCVVGAFGIYDLPFLFNASNYRSGVDYAKKLKKVVGENDQSLINASPVNRVKELKAPILLIAGRKDDRADFEHSNRFKYLLQELEHDVETMFYRNTGHGHSSYHGDKHEAAITFDYLLRALNLSIDSDGLSEQGKQAIAEDFTRIADGYEFKNKVDNNLQKAFAYYQKAAEMNHPRASYNVGIAYYNGEQVDVDTNKAIEFYKKSADLGFPKAYSKLGQLYMKGLHFERNWNLAKDNFVKAHELDDSPYNSIWLARFYCLAPDEYRDIERCLELMDLRQYKKISQRVFKQAKSQLREALPWIVAESPADRKEFKKIQDFIKVAYGLTEFEVSLSSFEDGRFTFIEDNDFGKEGYYEQQQTGENILRVDSDQLGIRFEVDIPGLNSFKDQVVVFGRFLKVNNDGSYQQMDHYTLFGDPKNTWSILENINELEGHNQWRFELYNLNRELIYTKNFILYDPGSS